jgi:predicted glycogen debranching enzyme
MPLRVDPETFRDADLALTREWLVTNGLGGFASSTVAGVNTRRYHGLLVAALSPPVQRMVLLAAMEEWLLIAGSEPAPLSAQEFWDGTLYPDGFRGLEAIQLDGMLPVFRWLVQGRRIEKRVWMEHGVNRTVISYRLLAGPPASLHLRPLFAHRDYHQQRHGQGAFDMADTTEGWMVDSGQVRSHFAVRPGATVQSHPDWYWRVLHRAERERGLDDEEDLFTPGVIQVGLEPEVEVTVVIGTAPIPAGWDPTASLSAAQQRQLVDAELAGRDGLADQLALAADQFRVARCGPKVDERPARTVVAGYHWFSDWGRDTLISLPGLALRPGMLWEARAVLETYLGFVDQGLIPTRFPDSGAPPEYDAMDATLWLFQALAAYLHASGDWRFCADRLETLASILDTHISGTRHNIRMDPADALLGGGEAGLALTWMDAKAQDWVVTPRRGKPVEVNALWYNALRLMSEWCERASRPSTPYQQLATQAKAAAAARFWYADGGYLYDVVDGPDGDDPSLRPNQVLATGLRYPLVEGARARSVLDVVTKKLLTPYGLRTLSPDDPRYQPRYQGDQRARDAAYHQGMVWPWLMGPYLDAHLRLGGDRAAVERMLKPFSAHLHEAGLGTISEIFEPEPPYRPVGCIAQAWSVAEILRHASLSAGP